MVKTPQKGIVQRDDVGSLLRASMLHTARFDHSSCVRRMCVYVDTLSMKRTCCLLLLLLDLGHYFMYVWGPSAYVYRRGLALHGYYSTDPYTMVQASVAIVRVPM